MENLEQNVSKSTSATQKTERFVAEEIDAEQLPETITKTIAKIADLSLKVEAAEKAAQLASKKAADASRRKTGIGKTGKAVSSLQDGMLELAKAQDAAIDAQKVSFEFQKQLAETTKQLFSLGIVNTATNRTVVRELEHKLSGVTGEKLSDLAKQELLGIISQLRAQEDVMSKVETNAKQINQQKQTIGSIKKNIYFLENDLDDVENNIEDIEKNIDEVEEDIDDIERNIDEVEEDIDDIERNIDEVEEDIDDVERNIDEVEEDIDDIERNIDEVEENIDDIEKNIDQVEATVEDNKKRIEGLEEELNSFKKDRISKKESIFWRNKTTVSKETFVKAVCLIVSAVFGITNFVGLYIVGKKINSVILKAISIVFPIVGTCFIVLQENYAEQYSAIEKISPFVFAVVFLIPSVLIIANLTKYICADTLMQKLHRYNIDPEFLNTPVAIHQRPISWVTPQIKKMAKSLFKEKYYLILLTIDEQMEGEKL